MGKHVSLPKAKLFFSLMPYVATCYLEFSDFSWELLKHVQFTLSCWNHLCLSPVATKITVLSSIEENNLEYKTFKWGFAIASSFMPAWRSLRLNLGYSSFPFFFCFVYSPFKGFIILVPDIYVNLKIQLLIPAHLTSLWPSITDQHFFAISMDSLQRFE